MADVTTRTIAGWSVTRVATALLLAIALIWTAWATRTLVALEQRQIVSVSLSRLVEDFVAAEARNGGTPEEAAKRTGTYLAAINTAVADLGRDGTTVLVSEATLGRSVEDRTADVRTRVARALEASRDAR
ncbi:TrbI F-type domain-containing protein [Sphingomonas profundi]|uniref:TrbI F-type domain-containing protein n=1 Tax=Alterirhizorhabdus profundi TaxID=2681549 RepID=UPI0018D15123|nr:TrbI F-type domain-containing protein [Sphingomonas profundi]